MMQVKSLVREYGIKTTPMCIFRSIPATNYG